MPEPLKNMFNKEYLQKLASDIKDAYPPFQADAFIASVMDETWESLELKARMRQITLNLGEYLPQDYAEAIGIIDKVVANFGGWLESFALFFPDFVEVYGQAEENWDISIPALARYTIYASAEFAVRPFIIKDEERMMAQMLAWSQSENEDVRRLSSEGSRPALPWAMGLPKFKADPSPVLPILENLKADPSAYVRKSVANNLNDISKTHPELVIEIAQSWYGENEHTNWIIKHGLRTLLKQGNPAALLLFGFADASNVLLQDFCLAKISIKIGDDLPFSFALTAKAETKVRLEYAIDYMKSNGKQSRKVFQISESVMAESAKKQFDKTHSFANLSTRVHYPGVHHLAILINGKEKEKIEFNLEA